METEEDEEDSEHQKGKWKRIIKMSVEQKVATKKRYESNEHDS